ncbi:MAG: hypothetical protein Q9168_007974 [Polycauliona sp. 1 TL-2023]
MYAKTAIFILGAIAAMGSASPVNSKAEAPGTVEARDTAVGNSVAPGQFHKLVTSPTPQAITHVYVCTDSNFHGRCQNLESTKQDTLSNGFSDTISSIGPDAGTTCTLYDDVGCGGASLGGIVKPGINNLSDYGFNDRASSYRCS